MNIFKKITFARKILKIHSEVVQFLDNTHLTQDIKNDIDIIKQALIRLSNKIPCIKELIEIIF